MINLFKSDQSLDSILTVNAPRQPDKRNGPISIFEIAQDHELKELFLLENTMSSFFQFWENCNNLKIKPRFGLKIKFNHSSNRESKHSHSIILFIKNELGYKQLSRLSSKAHVTNGGMVNEEILDEFLDENLILCIPFYNSFIFNNSMVYGSRCEFNIAKYNPTFFLENHNLPFDKIIADRVTSISYKILMVNTVLYYKREDFWYYNVYRSILNRKELDAPNINHFYSDDFCFKA